MKNNIVIVDLGIGNLANVKKVLQGEITGDKYKIEKAQKIVLPGVGNFSTVQSQLETLKETIIDVIKDGTPCLGICLGMQLLFEESEESSGNYETSQGLSVFKGYVKAFKEVRKPHIGWNQLFFEKKCPLFEGIDDGAFFYFVHSYYIAPQEKEIISGMTDYSSNGNKVEFPSAVWKNNLYGVQFHPEKSSKNGLRLLNNFKEL